MSHAPTLSQSDVPAPVTILERRRGLSLAELRELWRYRELLFFLAWRDIKVRYKQTALGVAWAVLQPLATMLAFILFMGPLAGPDATGLPYPLFVFAGLLPWMFVASAVNAASQSLISNRGLVTKVYFPRLLIPTGAAAASLIDFAVAFLMLLALLAFYGVGPGWGVVLLPLLLFGLLCTALGVGMLLAALTVTYRDVRYVIPFLVQFWMFATPGIYLQADTVQPWLRPLLPLNPAHGLITHFRLALVGGTPDLWVLAASGGTSLLALLGGLLYFRQTERSFADVI